MNKIPERCSDPGQLNKLVRVILELAIAEIKAQGVNPLIIETYRPQIRQDMAYCQGRTIAECVSKGINQAFAEAYCNPGAEKITWTLNSVHKSRKAVDVVPQRIINGHMTAIWNTQDQQTQIIIKTMQKYGFEAGANWTKTPDSPHFQVKGNFDYQFDAKHNTQWVTKSIQRALNKRINTCLTIDGAWGAKTTAAVITWRKSIGDKTALVQIGTKEIRALLS